MNVAIEVFDKKSELLISEIDVDELYLNKVINILNLNNSDIEFLMSGAGGFDISEQQVKKIELILSQQFYNPQYEFQLGTS